MAMVVKNNMSAVRTLNTLNKNSSALQKSLAKVSSGMKINSAQDDASGYAISERMRVQIRSLDQANQNTQNASSLMKTAEGAVSSTVEILKTLKEKAINAATDTNTDADRATIQKELNQFIDQIDDNALTTFNGKYLVDGSKSQSGMAVATAMTNQSLGLFEVDGTTELKGSSKLTNLTNRNGESLEISSTDYVTASFVKNGRTYTTKYSVGTTTLQDVFIKLNAIEGEDGTAVNAWSMGVVDASVTAAQAALDTAAAAKTAADNAVTSAEKTMSTKLSAVQSAISDIKNNITLAAYKNPTNGNQTASKDIVDGWLTQLQTVDNTTKKITYTDIGDITTSSAYKNATNPTAKTNVTVGWATNAGGINTGLANGRQTAYTNAVNAYNGSVDDYDSAVNAANTARTNYNSALAAYNAAIQANPPADMVNRSNLIGKDVYDDKVYTANGETGLTVTAASTGINGQISGLTISITDSQGNIKKSANASLDAFNTTIYAKNESSDNELTFQVGAKANQSITVGLDDMRSEALGLKGSDNTKVSVATQAKANAAVAVFDNAIQKVLDQQATIGAIESRLEYTSNNLTTSSENVQAAESTIRDADMAKEMTEYTKNNVLLQAAQSMLAQANQNSSAVLSLLQ